MTNLPKEKIFLFDRLENIVGKEENAGYEHVLLFPKCFQKDSSSGSLKKGEKKKGIVW